MYKVKLFLGCILVSVLGTYSLGAAEEPFTERYEGNLVLGEAIYQSDFSELSDGILRHPDWKGKMGEFIVESGKVRIKSEETNPVLTYLPILERDLTFRCRVLNASQLHHAGVLIYDTYGLKVNKQYGHFVLLKKTNSHFEKIIEKKGWKKFVKDPNDYVLTVAIKGDRLVAWLDESLLIDYQNPDLKKEGRFSFISGWHSDWYIEDFAVFSTLSLPEKVKVSLLPTIKGLKKGLTAYLPFDGDIKPLFVLGSEEVKAESVTCREGRVGQAVFIKNGGVSLLGPGNFNRPRGTISFWTMLDWFPNDTSYQGSRRILHTRGEGNFHISYYSAQKECFFMTGKTKVGTGFKWDYSTSSPEVAGWKPEEWHHVAVAWDAETGNKWFYLDGELVSFKKTEWMRNDPYTGNRFITLGSKNAPGGYDEWIMWQRVLTKEEIECLARYPSYVSGDLISNLPTTEKKEDWPIKFGLKIMKKPVETIVAPGETFVLRVPAKNPGVIPCEEKARFILLDFWEKVRGEKEIILDLNPGEEKELNISFVAPERGVFKVAVRIVKGDNVWERDVGSFAAWPEPQAPPDPNSFFGSHVNSWSGGAFLEQAARLGQGWMRNHNMLQTTWWKWVEPEPDEFKWTYDFQLEAHKKYQMPVVGQFFATPYWAARGGSLPKPAREKYPPGTVPDLNLFHNYVVKTVSRYKNYIRYWEVWNEPEVSRFWYGTPEEYAQLCKTAYQAAKEADPDCVVMVGGFTAPAWKWHEKAAKAGAFKYADIISFHYGCPMKAPEETYEELKAIIAHFQQLARDYGPGHELPLWSTEGGTADTTWLRGMDYPELPPENVREPMSWRLGTIRTIQAEAIQQSLGIVRHFYYYQNDVRPGSGAYQNTSMLEVTRAPKPKLIARVAFASQVDGTKYAGYVRKPEGRFWAVVYQKQENKGSVLLWWVGDKGKIQLDVNWPGGIIGAVNIMGNPFELSRPIELTDEPYYLHIEAPANRVIEALQEAEIKVIEKPTLLQKVLLEDKPDIPTLPDYVTPGEAPAKVFHVNLRPFCNMGFADEKAGDKKGGWADEGPLNDMRDFPTGKQTYYGVPFDIIDPATNNGRSVITLKGENVTPSFPDKVKAISLNNRRIRTLYFLHAAAWGKPGDIGKYLVRYQDGKVVEIPIKVPDNCHNWWNGYDKKEEAKPVPIVVTNTSTGKPAWRYVRVWEWENPRIDVPVKSIDMFSACGPQTPILIAISAVAR